MADAIAVCATCGMPVRVVFGDEGEVEQVFAVCGHPRAPEGEGRVSEERPVVFCFINSGKGTEWVGSMAMAEDGTCLAQHISSNDNFAVSDSGYLPLFPEDEPGWKKREAFEAHYPDGYDLEWVDDPRTHEGLQAAYKLNQQQRVEHDAKVGETA